MNLKNRISKFSIATSAIVVLSSSFSVYADDPVMVLKNPSRVPEVSAKKVGLHALEEMCVTAVKKIAYPAKLFLSTVDANVLDETRFNCVVSGKIENVAKNQIRYQTSGILHGTENVEYAVNGNIKTGKMDVVRTDAGEAKEVASLVLSGMFINIKPVSIEPKRAVYSAQVADGTNCTITMNQEGIGESVRWLASDVNCTGPKTAKK
jgi:hypothetical protein